MLIGSGSKKPNLQVVRRIKRSLHKALQLPEDAVITVTQLACLEKDCAPLETVVGLLRTGMPQVQHKLHKSIDELNADESGSDIGGLGFFGSQFTVQEQNMREINEQPRKSTCNDSYWIPRVG